MNHRAKARPVSGEIMAGRKTNPAGTRGGPGGGQDILDAQYETVGLMRAGPHQPRSAIGAAATGIGILKGGQPVLRPSRGGPVFWLFGLALVLGAFWVSGGHALLQDGLVADKARPNEALSIISLQTRIEGSGEKAMLLIDGEAANKGSISQAMPVLAIDVLGRSGRTTRYFLGTSGSLLPPGGRFPFSGRLLAPMDGVKSVAVRFVESGS